MQQCHEVRVCRSESLHVFAPWPEYLGSMRSIRFLQKVDLFAVDDTLLGYEDTSTLLAPLTVVHDVTLSSIRNALIRFRDFHSSDESIRVQLEDDFEGPTGVVEWMELVLDKDDILHIEAVCHVVHRSHPTPKHFDQLIARFLQQRDLRLTRTWRRDEGSLAIHGADITMPLRSRVVADVFQLGKDLSQLCETLDDDEMTRNGVAILLHIGSPHLLLGQYESSWLECKQGLYDLGSHPDRIELGQDVTRFANSESGGILICGIETKKDRQGDRLQKIRPIQGELRPHQFHKALDQVVYPPIDGMTVSAVSSSDSGQLLVFDVPPQSDNLKPFLVKGAVINGKVEGAFISIVRRRGEHSIPIEPAAIHAALTVGRAAMRQLAGDGVRSSPPISPGSST